MSSCPHCESQHVTKKSFFKRAIDGKKIRRFLCRRCFKSFSEQTKSPSFRLRRSDINDLCVKLLCQGMSQRAVARTLEVKQGTVALRVERFGAAAEKRLDEARQATEKLDEVMIDEMETFEHTKCKPLTMPIAIDPKSRKVLALEVGKIAAKGKLAAISRKKYGKRPCERSGVLDDIFEKMEECCKPNVKVKSDKSPHYPSRVARHFPNGSHETTKGRRGCIVGQGELKAGGFDPLFSLNHSYAMFRCNLKRLTRRTWCTTKVPEKLRFLMHLYAWFHNWRIDHQAKLPNFSDLVVPA